MKNTIIVDSQDSLDIEFNKMHQTTIKLGTVEIYIEHKKEADYLLETLEYALVDESETRSALRNKIEFMQEIIDGLEQQIEEMEELKHESSVMEVTTL